MKGQLKKIEIGIKVENVDQGGIGGFTFAAPCFISWLFFY